MGGGLHGGQASSGRRRRSAKMAPIADINMTPFIDVMLVLLIIFMVAAPLLTVGVPIDLPETKAKSLPDQKEPLTISINSKGEIYMQETRVEIDEIIPKLKAKDPNGSEERIFVRGDRSVDYGQVMKIMGRLSEAGFKKVALVTDVEQGK